MRQALIIVTSVVSTFALSHGAWVRARAPVGRPSDASGPLATAGGRGTSRRRSRSPVGADAGGTALLLDLIAVGAMAGLTGPLALRHACASVGGDLSRRLGDALARADLAADPEAELLASTGGPRDDALRDAFREIHRSDGLGTPLAERLAELARRERRRRGAEALGRARTAPVRMMFPLVFLVLPAFALMAVTPMLLMTLGSIR